LFCAWWNDSQRNEQWRIVAGAKESGDESPHSKESGDESPHSKDFGGGYGGKLAFDRV